MAETIEPTNTSGEPPNPAPESTDIPSADTTQTADNSLPPIDTSLPPIDATMPAMDDHLPSLDHALPPIDTTIPSLPPIDTSLPPLDTTLPATDTNLSGDPDFSFDTKSLNNEGHASEATNSAPGTSYDFTEQSGQSSTPAPTYQSPVNGTQLQPAQQQSQTPQGQPPQPQYHQQYGQPAQHSPAPQQHQQHAQGQPQQQYQQHPSPDMYSHQGHSTSMNTPSMQTMDPHSVQGQSSQIPQAPIGSPMPSNMPPMASVGQYMTGYPTNVGQMGMGTNAQMRYQLPGDPNKLLSGGRHKKEVKRRTKTGCLTCRKRRIKCDEGHPVCRNCVKSKRECLGYDPVFKQQPTPSAIQPAPNPHPSLVVNPQDPSTSYPAAPPGYMPAASQPFAPSESPAPPSEQYNYGTAIDPSLDVNNSSNMASIQHAVEGGLQPTVNPAMTNTSGTPSEPTNIRLKQVQISDLLALRGIPPPPPHPITSLPPNRLEEIQAVFLATYAPAIDKFFETRWFQEKALSHLLANAQLMAEYSALIDAFNDPNLADPNVLARLESFEASVVWSSMTLCRHVMNVSTGAQPEYDLLAAAKRLDVIEAMVTGEYVDANPLGQFPAREPATTPPSLPDQLVQRSLDFWTSIGHFLTLHDNEASSAKEIDDTLARCRTLLDTFENRDVIYSIAIARHLGQRWADFPRSFPQPIPTNEKDAGAKLYVAQKFLEQEAGGKGTTQVIKRLCGMVVRSWIVSRE
ncbi:C6 finger domain protein [Aspergillus sclerotiicarbonarius CBS 121057]|uniref:C6 finger domain protein n=1 Tax=Aspergillus sclerotiicarbonarius (strain CBS 121057 / IBT 28362) TaxID=1448318 RepID=A0A319FP46_ASPSB|nr:C6 finger domain protein [Aspergillus sclerotiicarbonarius CBS 121057]